MLKLMLLNLCDAAPGAVNGMLGVSHSADLLFVHVLLQPGV